MTDWTTQRLPYAEIEGCTLVQDLLPLYLDGEVTHESHVLIADHLGRCERCSGFLAGAQSVRAQMLKEQRAMRHAQTAGPTVAQLQQPMLHGEGGLVLVVAGCAAWVLGLGVGLFGLGVPDPRAVVLGVLVAGGAMTVLWSLHRSQTLIWKMLCLATAALGALGAAAATTVNPGMQLGRVLPTTTLLLLGMAASGWWASRRPQQADSTTGSDAAINAAALGLLAAAGCGLLGLLGLWLIAVSPFWTGHQFFGVGLAMAGAGGLVQLNQRLGWVAEWASEQAKRRFFGLILVGGGTLWSLLVLQAWGIGGMGSPSFLLAIGFGTMLALAGARWFQHHH